MVVLACLGICSGQPEGLGFVGTGPTGLELAVAALEDEPVRAGLTDAAIPKDERGVGLDDLEGVIALAGVRHMTHERICGER